VIVVSNTSPLTNLAAVGQLDLLRQIYHQIVIPEALFNELTAEGGLHPGTIVRQLDWVTCRRVSNPAIVTALEVELDRGEAEAITLSQELAADLLLIDEHLGRVVASRLGIRIIGLLGMLMEAKHQGLIPEIKALVDALMNQGFRIGNDLYIRVLEAAGEQTL
jgi:predicted nucleic acid-binding protein